MDIFKNQYLSCIVKVSQTIDKTTSKQQIDPKVVIREKENKILELILCRSSISYITTGIKEGLTQNLPKFGYELC